MIGAKRRSEDFRGFPASSLPGLRFDRRFVRKLLIENNFSMGNVASKKFLPWFTLRGRERERPPYPAVSGPFGRGRLRLGRRGFLPLANYYPKARDIA
jgi:hypothetical protein